ncbi:unnamed protein product [Sympodiomycopsis kandeliae]
MGIKQDLIAAAGEFVGTTLFLLLALGGAKTAQYTRTSEQTEGLVTSLGNQTIMFIAVSFGLSLLVNAWVCYRISGGLFNPAITLALFLIGGLTTFRAGLLVVAQLAGGIAGAALVAGLTPFGGVKTVTTTLGPGVNIAQGLFLEAFLTAILVLTVLFLAAEKHKSTYLAPIGIGLVLLACHLFGIAWTGCGMNPARSFGPAVVSGDFPGYHWIYWLGPVIGSIMAVAFYVVLKRFDYTSVVFGQDADHEVISEDTEGAGKKHVFASTLFGRPGKKLVVYHARPAEVDPASPGGSRGSVSGATRMIPATVAPYDQDNSELQEALQTGRASMLDPGEAEKGLASIATEHMSPIPPASPSNALKMQPVMSNTTSDTLTNAPSPVPMAMPGQSEMKGGK